MNSNALIVITSFLDNFLHKDWTDFNALEMREQSIAWEAITSDFKTIIEEHQPYNKEDFEQITNLINSYQDAYKKLPIEGKIYVKMNSFFLAGMLSNVVHELQFEIAKKELGNSCDCQLRNQFNKNPNYDLLEKVAEGTDGYYQYDIEVCTICNFKWASYSADDSTGAPVYNKWNVEDFPY